MRKRVWGIGQHTLLWWWNPSNPFGSLPPTFHLVCLSHSVQCACQTIVSRADKCVIAWRELVRGHLHTLVYLKLRREEGGTLLNLKPYHNLRGNPRLRLPVGSTNHSHAMPCHFLRSCWQLIPSFPRFVCPIRFVDKCFIFIFYFYFYCYKKRIECN